MPITPDTLVSVEPPVTVRQSVLGAIRQGAYPWVAAEAAGVPRKLFAAWLRSKKRRYRAFAAEVRKARAQARFLAEKAAYAEAPRDWLKYGPGREAPGEPGWSRQVPPQLGKDRRRLNPLADPAWRELFARLLDALTPYPDARTALTGVLDAMRQRDRLKGR